MKSNSNVGNKIIKLSNLLQNTVIVLPVFVRFQKVEQYMTVPVMHVAINGGTVEVNTTDGTHSIRLETLLDIVVFRDASGKTVFLTEFPTGGELAAEERDMIELWDLIEQQRLGVVKHSNVNDGVKLTMNVNSQINQVFNQCKEVINHRIAA